MPVLPVVHRAVDVRVLRALVASAQQQHQPLPRQGVIDPVARPRVDAQLPYAVTTEFVIAEVALLDAGHAPDHCHLGLAIPQMAKPVDVKILLPVGRQVVLDSVLGYFRL